MRVAVYPGSFDPITYGHLDVLRRALDVFDRVVVAILVNPKKETSPAEERRAAIRVAVDETLGGLGAHVEVRVFEGLTVQACRAVDARHIIRGLRAVSDFEAELQMAHMNRHMAAEIDTVFFPAALEFGYLSSSLVREIARFGGDPRGMVPPSVADVLRHAAGDDAGRMQ